MPSFKLPPIDRKDSPEEQVNHLSDSVERMRKEIEYALENLDSMNVAELTTEHTIIKSEYGETEIKGPILNMKDHDENKRLVMGLNKDSGLFSFNLKNAEGENTITLDSDGNAVFRGIIGILADDDSRTVIDGPLITMTDGSQDRINLGYNELYDQFEFVLKNKDGQETIYLDTDGNAVFKGIINVLQDDGSRTIIDGPLIQMTDGQNPRLNMGYNESVGRFEFALKNNQGDYTILINEDGNAIFEGYIIASSFVGGSIDIGNGTFKVDNNGNMEATSAYIEGEIEGSSFKGGTIDIGNGTFKVDSSGNMEATSAYIEGEIEGSSFKGGSINIGNGTFEVDNSGNLKATSAHIEGEIEGSTFTGGSINIGSGQFTVDSNGKLTAQNAVISGEINASSGTFSGSLDGASISGGSISGASISGGTIIGSTVRTNSSGTRIEMSGNSLVAKTNGTKRLAMENATGIGGSRFFNLNLYNENGRKNGQLGSYGNHTTLYNIENGNLRLGHNVEFEPTGSVNFAQTHVSMHNAASISGVVKDRNNDGIEITYGSSGIQVRDKNGNLHHISYD